MIDKLFQKLQEATDAMRDQASTMGEGAKEKTNQIIEDWLQVFPKLEIYGLEVTSFALTVAIIPSIEVELRGSHAQFTPERLEELMQANKKATSLYTVLAAIKTAYGMHRRMYASLREPLVVKIRVKLSPEIQVFLGEPTVA